MGDETLSVAQKARDHNLVGVTDEPEIFGAAPADESPQEKVQRGRKILRQLRDDDPGSGNLGLNIHMDGQTLNIVQKSRSAYIDEHNYIVFSDEPNSGSQTH